MTQTLPPPASQRPSPGGYGRSLAPLRRWVARRLARLSWGELLRTFGVVAPLTALIWVYAEREQIAPREFEVLLTAVVADPDRVVSLTTPTVSVTLSGPRSAMDRMAEALRLSGDSPTVQVEIDRALAPGQRYPLETVRLLDANAIFRDNGVTVVSASPARLPVFIDEVRTVELDVQIPENLRPLLGATTFDPPRVSLRAPNRTIADLVRLGALRALADATALEALRTPGRHRLDAVPVRVPGPAGAPLSLSPSTVAATVVVRQSDVAFQIASVPVWALSAPGLSARYEFEMTPAALANVTVVGPPEQIDLLQRGEFQAKAIVEIRSDNVPLEAARPLPVKFDLPAGVRVQQPELFGTVDVRATELAAGN